MRAANQTPARSGCRQTRAARVGATLIGWSIIVRITAALRDGRFRACVPHVTTVLDLHAHQPIIFEHLR